MAYTLTADELEATWGSREGGHPIFSRAIHRNCLLNGRTTETDYWLWVSKKSGYVVWTPETGWS
jgi:hypothetical protein